MVYEDSINEVKLYNKRLLELYKEIRFWVENEGLQTKFETIKQHEHNSGEYESYQLLIKDKNEKVIAKMKPYAIWIIGAEGRVDLVGNTGVEKIVYLKKAGPSLSTTISTDKGTVEHHEEKLLSTKEEGWHWIDHIVVGKKPKLTRELFIKLLEVVN